MKRFLVADEAESRKLHQELNEINYRQIIDRALPRVRAVTSTQSLDLLRTAIAPRPARIGHRRRAGDFGQGGFRLRFACLEGRSTAVRRYRRGTRRRAHGLAATSEMIFPKSGNNRRPSRTT